MDKILEQINLCFQHIRETNADIIANLMVLRNRYEREIAPVPGNVLLIDGKRYRIGDKVRDEQGRLGVIAKFDVRKEDDDLPFKVDFMGDGDDTCGFYGPNSEATYSRITLVEEDKPNDPPTPAN